MSDSARLNINITARDTAQAQIRGLQGTIRDLEKEIQRTTQTGLDTSGAFVSALTREKTVILGQIDALRQQAAAIKTVTAAIVEQGEAAAVVHRSLQEGIDITLGSGYERQIKSAADSARTLATSLSAAAEADARFRVGEDETAAATMRATDAMRAQGSAVRTLTGEQFFGVVERQAGLGQPKLSAQSSAAAFQSALGPPGTGITSAETAATINRLHGIDRELLSAKSSAAAFQAELGERGLGEKLTLTPAAGFSRLVGDLAGVKQNYLSAADSAAVFAEAEGAAVGVGGTVGAGLLQRESRHAIGLFDSLARGQRGQAISSIGAAARDAGLGVGALASSMGALLVVMGGVAVLRHAATLGTWATQMQAAAAATGMSVREYSSLAAVFQSLGLKSEQADESLRRLSRSMSTALTQPTSLAAEAFHNLGISQDAIAKNGNNVNGMLHLLADAFVRTAAGANKAQNMEEILGRGYQRLIPVLSGGAAGMDRMTSAQQKLGNTLDHDGAVKLEKMGAAVHELSQSIHGEGMAAMKAWAPVITDLAHSLEGLSDIIGLVLRGVGRLASSTFSLPTLGHDIYGNYAVPGMPQPAAQAAAKSSGAAPGVAVPALVPPVTPMETLRLQMSQAAVGAAGGHKTAHEARLAEMKAEIGVMAQTLKTAQLTTQQRTALATALAVKQTELTNASYAHTTMAHKASGASAAATAHQAYKDFASSERLKIVEADGDVKKIAAIYDQWHTEAAGKYAQHANVVTDIERQKTQTINTERLRQIRQSATDQEQVSGAEATLSRAGGPTQGTAQYATAAQSIQAQAQTEIQQLTEVMRTATEGSATQREAAHEILSVVERSKQQEIALYQKAAEAAHRATQSALAPIGHMSQRIGSSFQSLSDTLVGSFLSPKIDLIKQGLTTIKFNEGAMQMRAAFAKFGMSLVMSGVNAIENAGSQILAKQLSSMLGTSLVGGSGIGGLVTGGIDAMFGIGGKGGATGGIAGGIGKSMNTAQFGIATTQLQAAATQLQMAATQLQAGGAVSGAAGAASGAIGSAASAVAPITQAIQGGSALDTATQLAVGAAGTATTKTSTSLLSGVIQGGNAMIALLLNVLNLKPSVLGFSLSGGGVIPSAAGGMAVGDGKGGTLAVLHPQEMVLPAHLSRGIQGMIQHGNSGGRGNQATLHYAPTINTGGRPGRSGTGMTRSEFMQTMASHGGAMLGEARNMIRSGWRPG